MSRWWMVLGVLVSVAGQAEAQSSPWQAEERTTASLAAYYAQLTAAQPKHAPSPSAFTPSA